MPDVRRLFAVLDSAAAEGRILGDSFRLPDAWAIPILWYATRMPEWPALAPSFGTLALRIAAVGERAAVRDTLPPPLPARTAA